MGLSKVRLKELRRFLCPHCGEVMKNDICEPCVAAKTIELRERKKQLRRLLRKDD